jgi:alkylation response protein AidB-like acyl-CoA dehydrogenase
VQRDQFKVLDMWDVTAMRGSGSNDVVVEDEFIPAELVFSLGGPPRIDRPLYRGFIPALVFPGCTAVVLGAAQRAVDEVADLAKSKPMMTGGTLANTSRLQYSIAKHETAPAAARLLLHSATADLAASREQREAVSIDQRARFPDVELRAFLGVLGGSPRDSADTLRDYRDRFGMSYITVLDPFADYMAKVIAELR